MDFPILSAEREQQHFRFSPSQHSVDQSGHQVPMTTMHLERRSIGRLLRDTLAVVMAGGRGTRLHHLTATRCKPAVPFGGKYRIIDFTLSNCVNSGIRQIAVLTQYRAHSLIKHIERGWSIFSPEFNEFIELLPAQERQVSTFSYLGTADAVYQNLDIIREHHPAYVLVLAGDHIYKMDYGRMLAAHIERGADVTVGCVAVPRAEAHHFGVIGVDAENRIVDFREKPSDPRQMAGDDDTVLASMGIYLFRLDTLEGILTDDANRPSSTHDFGRDILPRSLHNHALHAYPFVDAVTGRNEYWRDVGTVDAYWAANLELVGVTPPLDLYDADWPIRFSANLVPPAKFVFNDNDRRGMAVDSLVSAGCIISGARVQRSVLCNLVHIDSYTEVEDSVILNGTRIGAHCRIRRAVIDAECNIPAHTKIGYDLSEDAQRFHVTGQGIVLISPGML